MAFMIASYLKIINSVLRNYADYDLVWLIKGFARIAIDESYSDALQQ